MPRDNRSTHQAARSEATAPHLACELAIPFSIPPLWKKKMKKSKYKNIIKKGGGGSRRSSPEVESKYPRYPTTTLSAHNTRPSPCAQWLCGREIVSIDVMEGFPFALPVSCFLLATRSRNVAHTHKVRPSVVSFLSFSLLLCAALISPFDRRRCRRVSAARSEPYYTSE